MSIELNVTGKIREFLTSNEGMNLIRTISDNSNSNINNTIIEAHIKKYLTNNSRIINNVVSDSDIKLHVQNYLKSYDGMNLINNLVSSSNDYDSKIRKFCDSDIFRNHVLYITQSHTYFDELFKNMQVMLTITNKVNDIAPKEVEREIRHQVNNIILEKFNNILMNELSQRLPNLVSNLCKDYCKDYCNEKIPNLVQNIASSTATATINDHLPTVVKHEMHTQFPEYIQNNDTVQNILSDHCVQLNKSLHESAERELEKLIKNDEHNEIVKAHLKETDRRCDEEISKLQARINIQLQQNTKIFDDQTKQYGNILSYQLQQQTSELTNHKSEIESELYNLNNRLSSFNKSMTSDVVAIHGEIRKLKNEQHFLSDFCLGLSVGLGILFFGGALFISRGRYISSIQLV